MHSLFPMLRLQQCLDCHGLACGCSIPTKHIATPQNCYAEAASKEKEGMEAPMGQVQFPAKPRFEVV